MNDKDTIYRQTAIDEIDEWIKAFRENGHKESAADACLIQDGIIKLPSAQPIYTDAEIQKMQDLESAQIEKAYQLGYEDGKKDAQPVDKDIDVPSADTISRQQAIDAIRKIYDSVGILGEKWAVDKCQMAIKDLPSVQPEPCEDAVSKNAIIQKLNTMDRYVSEELILCDTDKKFPKNEVFIVDDVYEEIVENLPSVQPEPLTDREQRLFLSAMAREEKVCKQVDDDFRYCREPYEEPLVRACKEIVRKVKGVLWTN